jgi:hypothetical protein
MAERTFITEEALLYRLECPIRANGSTTEFQPSPLLLSGEATASWMIAEIAAGRPPSANLTREAFDHYWKQTSYYKSQTAIITKEYSRKVMKHVHACWRLRELIWRREILQPVSRYELTIGDVVITGEYAVLRSSRPKTTAQILYLREGGVKIRPVIPDVVSFARSVHLGDRWLDSTSVWGIDSISVLHYWVSQDLIAEHKPDQRFAADLLHGAAGVVMGHPFPILGEHCGPCPTHACRRDC